MKYTESESYRRERHIMWEQYIYNQSKANQNSATKNNIICKSGMEAQQCVTMKIAHKVCAVII